MNDKRVPPKRLGRSLRRLNLLKRSRKMATKPSKNKATAALFALVAQIREKAIANWLERAHGSQMSEHARFRLQPDAGGRP
jgi:hypothetical protein